MSSVFNTLLNPEYIDAICLDMDGVLADLFGQEDWLYKLNSSQASAYYDAAPLVDTEYLNNLISMFDEYLNIPTYVVSWGSMNADWYFDKQTEKIKKYWLDRFLPAIPKENVFVVPYGTDKSSIVSNFCSYPILFDDTVPNCENWWWDNSVPIESENSNGVLLSTLSDLFDCKKAKCEQWMPAF